MVQITLANKTFLSFHGKIHYSYYCCWTVLGKGYGNVLIPTINKNNIINNSNKRFYFTNGDQVKRDDPYATLGLQWKDGATIQEIKQAYRTKSLEYHPDRYNNNNNNNSGSSISKTAAMKQFQNIQRAYEILIKVHTTIGVGRNGSSPEADQAWRSTIYRNGDRIAMNRTDVAGVAKKRPAPSAQTKLQHPMVLGHPDGRGTHHRPDEYIPSGCHNNDDDHSLGHKSLSSRTSPSNSVGVGHNKWVSRKEFRPWNGQTVSPIRGKIKTEKQS